MALRATPANLMIPLIASLLGCPKSPPSGSQPATPGPDQPPPSSDVVVADIPEAAPASSAEQGPTDVSLTGKRAWVKPGAMPVGASFTGVYYSPLFGFLHLMQQDQTVKGRWQRPRKGHWGELTGRAQGNLLRFEWTEHAVGVAGPAAKKSGRGYFVYERPSGHNVDDTLSGEVGFGNDEVGSAWRSIKQRNVQPALESIGSSEPAEVGGGDWDAR